MRRRDVRRGRQAASAAMLALLVSTAAVVAAQPAAETDDLGAAVRAQYEVTPITGGVALLPRDRDLGIAMIEVRGGTVIVDGGPEPATPQQLATRLGGDAAVLLRLMYLDTAAQRATLGLPPLGPSESASPGLETTVGGSDDADDDADEGDDAATSRRIVRRDIVRFGGNVRIAEDERVRGDVVVIGGSLDVQGEVLGEITVVGGSATFGPRAVASREVTVVGGTLTRDPGARFSRGVNEVTFEGFDLDFSELGARLPRIRVPRPDPRVFRSLDLAGTLIRLGFLGLLGSVVLLVAGGTSDRVARRIGHEPIKAGVVGFLAQLLFVPLLVTGIVLLVVTIIGIPLLLLVPVVLVAAGVVMVLGFTGAAQGVGQRLAGDGRRTGLVLFWIGLVLLMLPTLFGETLSLIGGPLRVVAVVLGVTGFVVEYLAWTVGLGGVILTRFPGALPGEPPPPLPGAAPSPSTPPPPQPPEGPPSVSDDLPLAGFPPDDTPADRAP